MTRSRKTGLTCVELYKVQQAFPPFATLLFKGERFSLTQRNPYKPLFPQGTLFPKKCLINDPFLLHNFSVKSAFFSKDKYLDSPF